jgi:hypothetical protein
MAYTTPRTWADETIVDADDLNVEIRDNTAAIRASQINVQSTQVIARTFSTASTSFVDITGLSVTITPSSATSKILVTYTVSGGTGALNPVYINIVRNSTTIGAGAGGNSVIVSPSTDVPATVSNSFIDSPGTTSATVYKLQCATISATFFLNRRNATDTYNGSSVITVMEIPV